MSQENVDVLRGAFEEFLAGKSEFGTGLVDPEVEWDASELAAVLDIDSVYRGEEGVRRFWRVWLSAWESVELESDPADAGDAVVALIDQHMRGRSTGIDVPSGKYAQVYTFRNGLIVRWKVFLTHAEALEAAGLSE